MKNKRNPVFFASVLAAIILLSALPLTLFAVSADEYAGEYAAWNDAVFYSNSEGVYKPIDGRMRLLVKPFDSSSGIGDLVYCFNHDFTPPDPKSDYYGNPAEPTYGFKKYTDVSNEAFCDAAANVKYPDTLKQDVLNAVWNGYPYYGGGWGGVNIGSNPPELNEYYGLTRDYLQMLWDILITQRVIWYYTDSISAENLPGVKAYMDQIIGLAETHPAPANFTLDLYDGSEAYGSVSGTPYQNLLGVNFKSTEQYDITVNKTWLNPDGSQYEGEKPDIEFELYDGTIKEGEQPLAVEILESGETSISFNLLEDGKQYTIHENLHDSSQLFTVDGDKVITADGSVTELEFTNTYIEPTVSVTVNKVWKNDGMNQWGLGKDLKWLRPDEITVKLFSQVGSAAKTEIETVRLSKGNNWSHTWNELPRFDADSNEELTYSVEEEAVPGYPVVNIKHNTEQNGSLEFTITNTVRRAGISIEKHSRTADGEKLQDAEFWVYRANLAGDNTPYPVSNDGKLNYNFPTDGTRPDFENAAPLIKAVTDSNGYADFKLLPKNLHYLIYEVKAPAGYLTSDQRSWGGPWHLYIPAEGSITIEPVGKDGNIVTLPDGNNKTKLIMINYPAAEMPETGSIGKELFTALGILLLAAPAVYLTVRIIVRAKRRSET